MYIWHAQCLLRLELLSQLWDLFEKISNETDVCDLKDGCLGILIDGCNDLAVLHACQVLNSTGDTSTQV